jgi:hydrogenase nickel incorporation protein HypA/HybF
MMHEVGILYTVAETVSKIAAENQVDQIKFISLEIGELVGIIPEFFEKYYPIVVEDFPVLEGSELKIRMIPGEALCDDCHAMYNIMRNEGKCPKCQSRYKTVLGGQEFMVKEIGC